jgi:hypothetical protein
MAGLGGGDLLPEHVLGIIEDLRTRDAPGDPEFVETGS